ncbi:TPA: 3'-5' exonuclease [Clostridioides difficile]|nr:3'-5' exonuclease [Clostridioides difficile]
MFNSVKRFLKTLKEPVLTEFDIAKQYDFSKKLSDDIISSFKSKKEIEYEKFIKFTNSKSKVLEHYVVFDLETTGLDASKEDIIEIAAIKFERDVPSEIFSTFVKPSKSIRKKITDITGITDEDVVNAPKIEEVLPHFLNFISDYTLIAHNAIFDMEFILDKLYKNGYKKITNKVIDTLALSRKYIRTYEGKKLKSYSLPSLHEELGLNYSSHRALEDCKSCSSVYKTCKSEMKFKDELVY